LWHPWNLGEKRDETREQKEEENQRWLGKRRGNCRQLRDNPEKRGQELGERGKERREKIAGTRS